jgi:branched-chain amino acid transport system substrate-binding protein
VPSRWLRFAALAAAVAALAGCGSVVSASETTGNQLTVYSSLPLEGPSGDIARQIEGGEKLALAQAGGHVGGFRVSYVSLDDVNPLTGKTSPGESSTAAKQAAQDTSTIAYLGDYGSQATAVTLPLINEAGILQVSPSSPYVGLTSSEDAGQDEPDRFYPSGKRTFVRLQGGDQVQAGAQAQLMQMLTVGSVFVIDDQDPFQAPLASLVADRAERAGVKVAGRDSIPLSPGGNYSGEIQKVRASGAQAVFVAGGANSGTAALLKSLHEADPHLVLLGSSSLAASSFTSTLGAAGDATYLTSPLLPVRMYPASGRRVLADYANVFHERAGVWALYGYETMAGVLDAIRRAGSHGNNRGDVISSYFATRDRESVLGSYSVTPEGETTLRRFGVYRVQDGAPVFDRAVDVP